MALMAKKVRRGVVPQGQKSVALHLPAPVGGLNTVSAASAMPPSDCLQLYNMIPFQYGLRTRSGYREWATGMDSPVPASTGLYNYGSPLMFSNAGPLGGPIVGGWTGNSPGGVRTILAFNGSDSAGLKDRLWAVTSSGIYDITGNYVSPYSATAPQQVVTFPATGLASEATQAGRGVGTGFVNVAGEHFYAYCDGFHGYYLYRESTDAWIKITQGATPGTQVNGVDPASFRYVMQWKSRLWFVPENSATAWYLDVGEFAGQAYMMPFAPRFKSGGELVGLWSWTVDGGIGIDDHLVGISRGGDVVIYSGTDPAIPGAFTLRGVWWVGNPPAGRRIASTFGGDLFILSVVGCVPLSKLVAGGMIRDPDVMASAKVSNLFNKLMSTRSGGYWSINIHPTDNLMVVNVPATPSEPQQQITMSLANQGWSQHIGVPMSCMETWRNKLYFGTDDGKVCVQEGHVDGLSLGSSAARPIDWAVMTSYQNGGSPNKKRVHMVRPLLMTDGTQPGVTAEARFDFDMTQVSLSPVIPYSTPSAWDVALWDDGTWDDGSGTAGHYDGAAGIGSHVSVVVRGTSVSEVTLVGFDVVIEQGGIL